MCEDVGVCVCVCVDVWMYVCVRACVCVCVLCVCVWGGGVFAGCVTALGRECTEEIHSSPACCWGHQSTSGNVD